ncbi:MAG: hypothetical protein LBS91_03405 [Clostridiales Family XIII bacterium]|nr:hypothetical protein [Clostridiales Family XIII bacterium]
MDRFVHADGSRPGGGTMKGKDSDSFCRQDEMSHKDQDSRIKQLYRICVVNSIGIIIAALAIIAVSTLRG